MTRSPGARTDPVCAPARGRAEVHAARAVVPGVDAVALGAVALLFAAPTWLALGYCGGVLLVLAATGAHRPRICLRSADELPRLAAAAASPLLAAALLPAADLAVLVRLALVGSALLAVGRASCYAVLRRLHRHGRLLEPTLVVGCGTVSLHLAELLGEHPELGLDVRGLLGDPFLRQAYLPPVLGGLAELPDVVRRYGIRRVLIAFPFDSDAALAALLRDCRPLPAEVHVVPRLHELGTAIPMACRDDVWGIPVVRLRRPGPLHRPLKRVFDVSAAALLLVLLGPLLLVLAAAVRLCTGGPVFFRQDRRTGRGRTVTITKLRTVIEDEPRGPESRPRWTVAPEHCTPLGRWLRATHLDELPQLLHVLRGEMSLVGPRPERPFFATEFAQLVPGYTGREAVAGGMTGWAQVHGLYGDTSIDDRIRFDNAYVEYASPWLDLVILVRTIAVLARALLPGHHSYQGERS